MTCENTGSLSEADKRRLIQAIDDDANWLLHMVENLLSVTRISDQTAGVKTTLEPLEEVVPAAVSRFHKRLPQAQVQVQIPDEFFMSGTSEPALIPSGLAGCLTGIPTPPAKAAIPTKAWASAFPSARPLSQRTTEPYGRRTIPTAQNLFSLYH